MDTSPCKTSQCKWKQWLVRPGSTNERAANVESQSPSKPFLHSSGMPNNSRPSSFRSAHLHGRFHPTSKIPSSPPHEKIPPISHEDSWTILENQTSQRNHHSRLPLHSMSQERSTHASIPAVSELLRRQPTLPIEATKHTKVRSKPLKPSLKLASQSLAWMHQPRDPTIRAVASCTAVTFGPENIYCQVSFKSQILPSHKILAFASDLRQPLKALIWSVQIGTNTSAPKIREGFESTLRQAHEQQEFVRVCWKETVVSLEQMRAKGQSSLVCHILWSQLHLVTQSLLQSVYRKAVVIVYWSFLSIFFGALFGIAYVLIVSYLG
jgi:hypothetical protein